MDESAPTDYEALRAAITERHGSLSKRLRQIANYALDHPTDMAIETIAVIAKRAEVQPSALIRFAKSFDYTGFSQMQRAFQTRIAERSASYKERVRAAQDAEIKDELGLEHSLLNRLCATNTISLTQLSESNIHARLAVAVDLLEAAGTVYVVGHRRSFPVAAYIAYSLSHAECRTHLLDGVGGMLNEQAQCMSEGDALLAISYSHYAHETADGRIGRFPARGAGHCHQRQSLESDHVVRTSIPGGARCGALVVSLTHRFHVYRSDARDVACIPGQQEKLEAVSDHPCGISRLVPIPAVRRIMTLRSIHDPGHCGISTFVADLP